MESIILTLLFSGPATTGQPEDDPCLKAEVEDVGLSESACGGGNSDLYEAMMALISGQPLPTVSSSDSFGASVWAQDLVGNGYGVTIAKGTLNVENSVTTQPIELIDVSPSMIKDGLIDLEQLKGWALDKIWSASWAGSVFENKIDPDGTRSVVSTAKPALTIDGSKIKLTPAKAVYGAIKIKYELTRDRLTVTNDGTDADDDSPDPYSTSLTFDVDGCDEETVLQLPSTQCLKDRVQSSIDDLLPPPGGKDVESESPPPTEGPKDTGDDWDYCTLEWISGDSDHKEGTTLG